MASIMRLTAPLFSVFEHAFSGRDLILLVGGLFLLFKATMELHERLEVRSHEAVGKKVYAGFGLVVTQVFPSRPTRHWAWCANTPPS